MNFSLFDTEIVALSSTGTNALFHPYALPKKYKTETLNFYKLYTNHYTENFATDIGIAWNISVNDIMAIENFMKTLHGEGEFRRTFFPVSELYYQSSKWLNRK